jgi:hypothetical protein
MPLLAVGDLVQPKDNPFLDEENPGAIGIIVEMRDMRHMKPEAKVLWNDMLDIGPKWTFISEIKPLEVTEQ